MTIKAQKRTSTRDAGSKDWNSNYVLGREEKQSLHTTLAFMTLLTILLLGSFSVGVLGASIGVFKESPTLVVPQHVYPPLGNNDQINYTVEIRYSGNKIVVFSLQTAFVSVPNGKPIMTKEYYSGAWFATEYQLFTVLQINTYTLLGGVSLDGFLYWLPSSSGYKDGVNNSGSSVWFKTRGILYAYYLLLFCASNKLLDVHTDYREWINTTTTVNINNAKTFYQEKYSYSEASVVTVFGNGSIAVQGTQKYSSNGVFVGGEMTIPNLRVTVTYSFVSSYSRYYGATIVEQNDPDTITKTILNGGLTTYGYLLLTMSVLSFMTTTIYVITTEMKNENRHN